MSEDFAALFKALTEGKAPFRWQSRLYERFAAGDIPDACDIPTGLGKTAVMTIWLAALDARPGAEVRLPRRLVYVVDRRAVVDQATDEAEKLKRALGTGKNANTPIEALRKKLLLEDGQELAVSTLRGQLADNRAWLEDISRPAIVVGTVDMIGSRLLFSGYNVSRGMRPVHAALLGNDALIVLDEAHLVPPFQALVEQVQALAGDDREKSGLPTSPMRLLTLSATGHESNGKVFRLEREDAEDKEVEKRLNATKRLKLEAKVAAKALAETLAERAWERAGKGETAVRVIVFCHSNRTAREVHEALSKKLRDFLKAGTEKTRKPENFIELTVGARRVRERERVAEEKVFRRFANKLTDDEKAEPETMPAFIVATAAGEVGVDIDADHMVSDLVAWERMVQRLGRVNRFGRFAESLIDVFPAPADVKDADFPIEDENLEAWRAPFVHDAWTAEADSVGRLDASPGALRALRKNADFAAVAKKATTPPPLRPALTRALVDAWSMTSLETHTGRPAVAPWIRGWEKDEPQTTLVWRRLLPVRDSDLSAEAERQLEAFFEAAPPHVREGLETYTYAAAELMTKRAKDLRKSTHSEDDDQGEGEATQESEGEAAEKFSLSANSIVAAALASDRSIERVWRLRELAAADAKRVQSAIAGRTVVLHAALGGLTGAGLIEPGTKGRAAPTTLDDKASPLWTRVLTDIGYRVRQVRGDLDADPQDGWRAAYRRTVSEESEESGDDDALEWRVEHWFGEGSRRNAQALSKFDQYLDDHHQQAEEKADEICGRLGLPEWLCTMVIAIAGIHDSGKARRIWQRFARNPHFARDPKAHPPLAKFKRRSSPNLLKVGDDTYRHEFGSLCDAQNNDALKEIAEKHRPLALHMLAAHHGNGRPTITPVDQDAPPEILATVARQQLLRFHVLQTAWGPWGLAWLEALLRAADAQASQKLNETGEGKVPAHSAVSPPANKSEAA